MERTFVMVKPDGVQRGLVGEIIRRFEVRGLQLVALKLLLVSPDQAGRHYEEHAGKPFYDGLVSYITSGSVVAMVIEGKGAVGAVRTMLGATNPLEAAPGTIRGDLGQDISRNMVHGSDSVASAQRETAIYFSPAEIYSYDKADACWIWEN